MKLLHATVQTLSDREFDKVSEDIAEDIYNIVPEIKNIYTIHIDMINDEWHIEFVPISKNSPVIKVNTYTSYNNDNKEVLHITPIGLIKFPDNLKFNDYEDALDAIAPYNVIVDFVLSLYDFEYIL